MLATLGALLAASCAQVEAPSGGPEDKTLPRVLALSPDSGAVEVRPDTISILFSKKMDRRSVLESIRVTPPLSLGRPEWRGNLLAIPLREPPDTAKTYTILISAAAKDRRGNALGPWVAPFSTGPTLDDGVVEGKLHVGRIPLAGVDLYAWPWSDGPPDTSSGEIRPALRVAPTGKDGSFRMEWLPRDTDLEICALYDRAGDRVYDADEDVWGCLEQPVRVGDTTRAVAGIDLYLVYPEEPGTIGGTAIDSTCIGRGAVALRRFGLQADSLRARIAADTTAAEWDTLRAFAEKRPAPVDTTAIRARIVEIEAMMAVARADSARCAAPILVRLFREVRKEEAGGSEEDSSLVAEDRGDGTFTFGDVDPGTYRVLAFRDSNADGQPSDGEPRGGLREILLLPGRVLEGLVVPLKLP
ncbi:MAG: Ig-like domain-containing protein [Candidatus Eisenbacteria bacterium]